MKKTVCELFAGVGGFRLGLEKSGDWEVVWANQWEPNKTKQHAFNCYATNFQTGIHVNEDISKVHTSTMPDYSVLVGGFPCQDYSVARTQAKGIQGKKGVLFWEITRLIEEKQPAFVLLENVDRLLKSPAKQRGRDFAIMLTAFRDLGYHVEWRVINAAEYGFTQKRKRVFIFASRKNTAYAQQVETKQKERILHNEGFFCNEFPIQEESSVKHVPTSCTLPADIVEVSDDFSFFFRNAGIMIDGEVYSEESLPVLHKQAKLKDILEQDVDEKYYLKEEVLESWKYLKGAKVIERVSKTGHKYNYTEGKMAFPDHLDAPGRTMLTSEGSKNRSSHVIEDPETKRIRILTPVECERLNGFDDNWTNSGMPERMRYFCMGNALVVPLITKMGNTLSSIIEKED